MMPGIGFIGKHLHLSTATIYIYVLKYGPIQSNIKVCFGLKLNENEIDRWSVEHRGRVQLA